MYMNQWISLEFSCMWSIRESFRMTTPLRCWGNPGWHREEVGEYIENGITLALI
jgi:hypothetical protein